jgi:hypothetical protein
VPVMFGRTTKATRHACWCSARGLQTMACRKDDAGIDFTQADDGRLWVITRNDIAELRNAYMKRSRRRRSSSGLFAPCRFGP